MAESSRVQHPGFSPDLAGTKKREHFLTPEVRRQVIKHIGENARVKRIFIDTIYGHTNHIHCLIRLNANMSIAKTLNLLEGESSHWINTTRLIKKKFEWADEYFGASVSESIVPQVRCYLRNQDRHHASVSYEREYDELINAAVNGGGSMKDGS